MANNYEIDYTDKRFTQVEQDKQVALTENENTYNDMIAKSDKYYQDQVNATDQWGEKQAQLQKEQHEFALQEIERQKADAKSDYIKEQTGAYVDWRKQSNEYGAEAEKMAASGLQNTGYSESSQVSMYNAYQNRVATALESFNRIIADFNSDMTAARLQNSTILAEIAYQTQHKKLELTLAGFQYKNQLLLDKANKKTEINNTYYNRYQDVLAQINHENSLAEQIRQYNESLALEREQFAFQKQKYADEKKAQEEAARAASRTVSTVHNGRTYKSSGKESARANSEKILKARESKNSDLVIVNSPLTPEGAAERVARGELIAKQVGNKVYLSNNPNYVKGQALLDKYTALARR